MNSRSIIVAMLWVLSVAGCLLAAGQPAAASGAAPVALVGEAAGDDFYVAAVTLDADKKPLTSVRQRVDVTRGKWVEIARLAEQVIALAPVGGRLAVASADEWRLIWDGGGVTGAPLPTGRRIDRLAGDGTALWALAGPEIFRWTADTGWQQRGALPGDATPAGASILVRDGVPIIAYLSGNAVCIDRAQGDGWKRVAAVPTAEHGAASLKLLAAEPAPLMATINDAGVCKLYALSEPSPKPFREIDLGRPGDVAVSGGAVRGLSLQADGVHQIAIDQFGRGHAAGPDLIAQVLPPPPAAADWPDFVVLGMATAAVLIATRTRSLPRSEALAAAHVHIAPIGRRLGAGIIDAVPYVLGLAYVFDSARAGPIAAENMGQQLYLPVFAGLVVYVLHVMICEIAFGRSLGKLIFGLRVVTVDGDAAPPGRIVLRNLMRVLDVALGLPFIIIMLSPTGQRFGDMAARTLVVADDAVASTPGNDSNP